MTWRERLREEIARRGMTEKGYAKSIGLHPTTLSQYLTGERMPKADFFLKVRASGVSTDYLFAGEGSPDADAALVNEPMATYNAASINELLDTLERLIARLRPKPDRPASGG